MDFAERFAKTDPAHLRARIAQAGPREVERALARTARTLEDFAALVSPAAAARLDELASEAGRITRARFGPAVRLYAPVYLSNECGNLCTYCAFSVDRKLPRRTLTPAELAAEAAALAGHGIRQLLLVSGEAERIVGVPEFTAALRALRPHAARLDLEVQPLAEDDYRALHDEGLHGVVVYQETYDRAAYARHHPRGRKADFFHRLATPERAGRAGVRAIGVGALLGLADWRLDAWFAALHLDHLRTRYWRTRFAVSFPRIRPQAGAYAAEAPVGVRDLIQLICAFRLLDPDLDLVLSTREPAALRDRAFRFGITTMSAGSRANPGGYATDETSLPQFSIDDERPPEAVAAMLRAAGYDPVFKDWDPALA